jgi:hypothetical protein
MTDGSKANWIDEQIVQHMRNCAIEYSKCGFNMIRANRIMDKELRPSYEVLKHRGDAALRKLLPLLSDENSTVQWVAAGFAYDVEPAACRRVLEQVMQQRGVTGIMAFVTLAERNLDSLPPIPDTWT